MTERQTYRDYPRRRLYRSDDSVIFGVCGGIAEYFDLSPWGLRLVWVIASIPALWLMLPAYIILGFTLKRRAFTPDDTRRHGLFYGPEGRLPNSAVLGMLRQRFDSLDRRLQRLESEVTSPGFRFDRELRAAHPRH